jgi:hypothetical protein
MINQFNKHLLKIKFHMSNLKTNRIMNFSKLFFIVILLTGLLSKVSGQDSSSLVKYGDNFIVFEAEATQSDLGLWVKRTPDDPKYYAGTDLEPINKTYIEFTGNNMNGGPATSTLTYKFKCPKSGDYRVVMRMYQPLEAGEKDDKRNDIYIRLDGDYETACDFPVEMLSTDHKFFGRGVRKWGSLNSLEGHVNGKKKLAPVIYKLIKGETYTFAMSGRAQGCSIDYILFYENDIDLIVNNDDLATQNHKEYRP